MGVSLYTSRVVLEALGVEDFGVYNVVGGIIGFMGFLNSSLSGAISRFITFELGNNNLKKLKETFSSSFLINSILAILIIILGESIGLWFLNNKLSIPENSIYAANWVYQFTILGMIVSVTQIPYTADVIAHEKMSIYAYIELLVAGLRLVMAYILLIINSNHLIWYSAAVTGINILIAIIYRIYCVKNFEESKLQFIWKTELIKPILYFSGWNVLGNLCLTLRVQGLTILINLFFGVFINAANGIANQVNNNILSFSSNIVTAYRPQIIKSFASHSFNNFSSLIADGAKFSLVAMLCIVIPLNTEINYVLELWLKNTPKMTNILCQLALIASIFGTANYTLNIGIQATGKIKSLSITNSFLHLIILGGSYIALKLGGRPQWIYYVTIIVNFVLIISSMIILKNLVKEFNYFTFIKALLKVTLIGTIGYFISLIPKIFLESNFQRLLTIIFTSCFTILFLSYHFLLSKSQRLYVRNYIKYKIFK